jgi:hypothetical protein
LIERLEICLANISRDEDDSSPYFIPAEGVTALHQYAEAGAKSKEMLGNTIIIAFILICTIHE